MLNTGPVSPRASERQVQELLYLWTRKYFTGAPHTSKLGDVTFPEVDIFFNQTEIPSPTNKPQLHFMFTDFRKHEMWQTKGDLSAWESTLSTPFSGVSYGRTQSGTIEESIHGKLARTIEGTNLRLVADGAGLHEQAFTGTWQDVRFFANAAALRFRREGGNYVEEVQIAGVWIAQRTITTGNPLWDGAKKLVRVDTMIGLYIRTVNHGESDEAPDYLCRNVADNFAELLADEVPRAELTQKGFRRIRVARGPSAMASTGFQSRMMVLEAQLRYFQPREQ